MNWKNNFPKENRYYETENGILYNGDCVDIIKHINNETINFVITSPPYNLEIDYGSYSDSLPYQEYINWCESWGKEIFRILEDDGRFCLNHYLSCGKSKFRFAPIMDLNWVLQQIGFKHYGVAIWWDTTLSKRTAWGSWLSASSPYISSPFEGILILYKNQWKLKRKGESDIDKKLFMELTSGVWKIAPEKRKKHPAPFPLKLVEHSLKLLTYKRDLVLDPFIGSGTTAVAAEKLNRRWIGIELSKEYCDISIKRLEEVMHDKK